MIDVLFINATDAPHVNQEINGTMLLATKLLQAGFEVQVLRFCEIPEYGKSYPAFIQNITNRILALQPRCVSFYTLWPNYHIMLHIAEEVKKNSSSLIILGGPQASATATSAMEAAPYVDYICTGEGESTIVPFFHAVLQHLPPDSIPGIYYRESTKICFTGGDPPLCDLNTLPNWDDRLCLLSKETNLTSTHYFMPIDAGRGCPYNCTFCCTSRFWRRTYRLKSPERIIQDIRFYQTKYKISSFWFSHDAFTTNQKLVSAVCKKIIDEGLNIHWRCSARLDCITPELIQDMINAGMIQIELGVETGSARMQKLTNKNLDLNKVRSTVAYLLNQKIDVCLFFMYGFPEETEQDLNDTLQLAFDLTDMGVRHMNLAYCRFNPSTAITEKYYDQLVFDPQIKVLFRKTFGYIERQDFIRGNKALFPCYFHLHTPVRDQYQYVILLHFLYQQFPKTAPLVRSLYNGDNLALYRDFYNYNLEYFRQDMDSAVAQVRENLLDTWRNTLKSRTEPYITQVLSMLEYEYDIMQLKSTQQDTIIDKTYHFNILEYKLKTPAQRLTDSHTHILLKKGKGVLTQRILSIK